MIPLSPRFRLPALALVASLALAACGVARPPAATVDGVRITDDQLQHDVALFQFLSSLSRAPCGTAIPGETARSACARFTLSNLIQQTLVRRYAQAHHVTVLDSTVTAALAQLEVSLGGADKLNSMLKDNGLTSGDLRDLARRLLLFREVQRAVAAERISDVQLHQTYEANLEQYTQLHAEHILVKTRSEADRIERRVTPGNFARLAKKYSTDTTSAKNGGDLGTVQASQFDPTFVQAALALAPGQISRPVHSQFGWHIIELISEKVTPFGQVKAQLLDQAAPQVFDNWLQGQLASASISVNPKYGRLNTTTGQVEPIRSTATGAPSPTLSGAATPASPTP